MGGLLRNGARASCNLNIRLTPAEREAFSALCRANGARSTSDYARLILLGEANDCAEGGSSGKRKT
jgi:hypothetical protein